MIVYDKNNQYTMNGEVIDISPFIVISVVNYELFTTQEINKIEYFEYSYYYFNNNYIANKFTLNNIIIDPIKEILGYFPVFALHRQRIIFPKFLLTDDDIVKLKLSGYDEEVDDIL